MIVMTWKKMMMILDDEDNGAIDIYNEFFFKYDI